MLITVIGGQSSVIFRVLSTSHVASLPASYRPLLSSPLLFLCVSENGGGLG